MKVYLSEEDGCTRARAVLDADGRQPLEGHGTARCSPRDVDVPEIGDELATSRALSDLGHQLLEVAAADVEAATHAPAVLTH